MPLALIEKKWRTILEKEGWKNIEAGKDPAGLQYPPHTHDTATTHVVLDGEMELIVMGIPRTLRSGDRFDAPAGTLHEARIGEEGCTYLVAEK